MHVHDKLFFKLCSIYKLQSTLQQLFTFCEPDLWGDNSTMGTLVKQSTGEVLVLINDMAEKGIELGQYQITKFWPS